MSKKVRVRFAPSPTGPLHPGGVRTALFNYLLAKKEGGTFILRIEDTDQNRFVPGAEEFIIKSLKWCGLEFDEGPHVGGEFGPYRQSERRDYYKQYADQLIDSGHAYYAFDTPEELTEMRERLTKSQVASPHYNNITRVNMKNSLSLPKDEVERRLANGDPYVIRFKMPRNEEVKLFDLVRGWVSFNSQQLDDKVLMKGDGMPTYHLANVVDDYNMQISHVIRGEEWLPSAPLHVLLYKSFGWEDKMPHFAHLSLLLKPDGKGKLSKRDGDKLGLPFYAINWTDPTTEKITVGYRESGYLPEAYLNFLSLLGWNPGDNREKFNLQELVEAFSVERINKSGARYDFDKLKWFNQQYLKEKDNKELAALVKGQLDEKGIEVSDEYLEGVCNLMKDRWVTVNDFWDSSSYFFEDPVNYDEKVARKKWKNEVPEVISEIGNVLIGLNDFSAFGIESAIKSYCEEKEIGIGKIMQPLRLALSGLGMGPAFFEMVELLGKEVTVRRIKKAVSSLEINSA